jgi:Rrf2 family protein
MRLELTRRGDYAVRAMLALGHDRGGLLSVRHIAAEMAVPARFLPQVMADLVRARLVEGVPGRRGGYRLALPARDISLLAIVEAVEGDSRRRTCILRGGPCLTDGKCCVHDAFFDAQEAMITRLDQVKLDEVCARTPPEADESDRVQ